MNYLDAVDINQPAFGDVYDELPLWSAPFGLMLLECVPVKRGITVLDIGAGTGFLSIELAQRCGNDATVIAVDPWATSVARLRRKLEFWGISNVRVLEQDAASVTLEENSVDLIVSNLGVNNFENAGAVLQNCARIAKPGAVLLLTTNLVGHMQEFYGVYRATLTELGRTDCLPKLDEHIQHRSTAAKLEALLKGTGFANKRITTDSFRIRFADGSALLRHALIRFGFLPAWKAIVPESAVAETFAALERNLNAAAMERGELALTIPMACVEAIRA